jgi:hypothetical protein
MFGIVSMHIEVYRTVYLIGKPGIHDLLNQFLLLNDMSARPWFNAGMKYVQRIHVPAVAVHLVLHHFHGFEGFQSGLHQDLVLSFVRIIFQVSYIGDITNIPHFIAQVLEIPEEYIKGYGLARVTQVSITINSGTTGIETNKRRINGFKSLLFPGQGVVYK